MMETASQTVRPKKELFLPPEVWRQILTPPTGFVGIAGKCLAQISHDADDRNIDMETLLFAASHSGDCFCQNSSFYRNLRLVNKVFNSIVSEFVFSKTTILYEKEWSLSRLEDIARSDHLRKHVKEHIFLCRKMSDEDKGSRSQGRNWQPYEEASEDREQQREFLVEQQRSLLVGSLSLDPYTKMLEVLSLYPNMDTLVLEIGHNTIDDFFEDYGPHNSELFLSLSSLILSAFLQTCYQRTLAPPEYRRIKSLCVQHLCDIQALECLTTTDIEQGILGMAHVEKLQFYLVVGDKSEDVESRSPQSPRKLFRDVLGRLVRGAGKLCSLSLRSGDYGDCYEHGNIDFDDIVLSPGSPNPGVKHWKTLSFLDLQLVTCHMATLSTFLNAHRGTLDTIIFEHVKMKDVYTDDDPWTHIFTTFKECEPVDKLVYLDLAEITWCCGTKGGPLKSKNTWALERLLRGSKEGKHLRMLDIPEEGWMDVLKAKYDDFPTARLGAGYIFHTSGTRGWGA